MLLVLSVGLAIYGAWRSPVEVSATPAAVAQAKRHPAPANAPYRLTKMYQYWAMGPKETLYALRAEMTATRAGTTAILPIRSPSYAGTVPANLRVSGEATFLRWDPRPHPQGYSTTAPVLVPSRPLAAGERWGFTISWTEPRIPFLHENGGASRMLSITQSAFPDDPRSLMTFAIPDTSRDVRLGDLQPYRQRRQGGWLLYDYDCTNRDSSMVHIGFQMGTPRSAPPAPDLVIEQGAAQPPPSRSERPAARPVSMGFTARAWPVLGQG
ncbi:MAG: hypothetical protein FJX76_19920, partial [Armatimonadetes bacterium]|nr:hypothetical protein [Armatimonadota bacterium]